MSSYQRKIGDVIVTKTRVIGTQRDIYSAWEPGTTASHYTITSSIDDGEVIWHGRIDTTFMPDAFETLPRGEHRLYVTTRWNDAQNDRAIAYIYAAFPEIIGSPHMIEDGQIIVKGEHV